MHPGTACVECHAASHEGPSYAVAGTLYPTWHEPDDCDGIDPSYGAKIIITDANGTEFPLAVNSAGNFMLGSNANLVLPYRAKVVYGDLERAMLTAQTTPDCNACHTERGAQSAPGRILLPD
jgi:cytochrome c553